MSYLKEEIKAGAIVLAALAIVAAFVILIGGKSFRKDFDVYYVRLMDTTGLEAGSNVRLGGIRVGEVADITLPGPDKEPAVLRLNLKKNTPLYKGVVATVSQVGMVGETFLMLEVQNTTSEKLKPGAFIDSKEAVQMRDVMAKMNDLSVSFDKLIADLHLYFNEKNLKEMEALLKNSNTAILSVSADMKAVSEEIFKVGEKIHALLDETESLVKSNKSGVGDIVKSANEDLKRAAGMLDAVGKAASALEKTSGNVDRALVGKSRGVDAVMKSIKLATDDLHELLQEIKHKPYGVIYRTAPGEREETGR
jgi:phospholipid/cholesterol/gamma-HCH transport system substrate-binding protein